ncbi:hypothetical protein RSOL_125660, partial [Rhizoctonia solani AG-3 Rhs1AP]
MLGLKVSAVLAACASMVAAVPTYKQTDACGYNYFWFAPKGVCLWNGTKDKCDPPAQQNCGKNWYWHKSNKYCVPPTSSYGNAECNDGWNWDDSKYSCVPAPEPAPAPGQCNSTHFYWKTKTTCLPYGGDSTPPSPPNGYQCPDKWYWRSAGHCAPRKPDYGNPDCDNKYTWDKDNLYCTPRRY